MANFFGSSAVEMEASYNGQVFVWVLPNKELYSKFYTIIIIIIIIFLQWSSLKAECPAFIARLPKLDLILKKGRKNCSVLVRIALSIGGLKGGWVAPNAPHFI